MLPLWRQLGNFTYTKSALSEMLKEIVAGSFSKDYCAKRLVLVQSREKGLCQFEGKDEDAHLIAAKDITIIPQPEMQRGNH